MERFVCAFCFDPLVRAKLPGRSLLPTRPRARRRRPCSRRSTARTRRRPPGGTGRASLLVVFWWCFGGLKGADSGRRKLACEGSDLDLLFGGRVEFSLPMLPPAHDNPEPQQRGWRCAARWTNRPTDRRQRCWSRWRCGWSSRIFTVSRALAEVFVGSLEDELYADERNQSRVHLVGRVPWAPTPFTVSLDVF